MKSAQGPFRAKEKIVLASGSPRRRDMLQSLGIDFVVEPSKEDEPAPKPGEKPGLYAIRTARFKAEEVAANHPGAYVIGSDTIVAVDGVILGKPKDEDDAVRMLQMLAGKEHEVISGTVVLTPDGGVIEVIPSTRVRMSEHDEATLRAYVRTGEPMDKAGAYAIQGIGSFLVVHVEGSYTNVVGLPLARVLEVLLEWSVVVPIEG